MDLSPLLVFSARKTHAGRRRRGLNAYSPRLELLEERLALTTLPPGFTETVIANGISNPTAMEFSPDGKLFITQQTGTMQVWLPANRLQTDFFLNAPLTVDSSGERGLLGIAFDPNFAANRFVYVYYTTTAADHHNRVSRLTANATGDLALAGSETVLLELDPHAATNHNGGAIHFGPDGKLYIAAGDDANQDNPTGVHNSQRLTTLHGKMMRINADGSIPADNPFIAQTTGKYQAIWAMGLRNPFTFAFQPGTGRMFINDVGEVTWEEIDDGIAGSNYGWRTTEGDFNQASFPNLTRPQYAYNHSAGITAATGSAITGGAFYDPTTSQFPGQYVGEYFFCDFTGSWIYAFNPTTKAVTQFATGISAPVDLKVDAAGNLYVLSRGSNFVERLSFVSPWQNTANPLDVNKSGAVNPLDAILVINDLNANGSRQLPIPATPTNFIDVSGDAFLAPLDAILVINALNAGKSTAVPAASGETIAAMSAASLSAGRQAANEQAVSSIVVRSPNNSIANSQSVNGAATAMASLDPALAGEPLGFALTASSRSRKIAAPPVDRVLAGDSGDLLTDENLAALLTGYLMNRRV